jgi:proton-dependent oligopeptide transporter, POT family
VYGWHIGFGSAGVAMALGLIIFYFGQNYLGEVGHLQKPVSKDEPLFSQKLTSSEINKLKVLGALAIFSIIFWMSYEQGGSSMSVFAKKYTDRTWGDSEIPSSWFQSLNPFFVFAFAPLFAWLWDYLGAKGKNPHAILKFAMGMMVLGSSFILLYFASKDIPLGAESAKVSLWFWVGAIFIQTIGELLFYPIGLSLVSSLAPKHLTTIIIGLWMFSMAIGNYLSGTLAGMIGDMPLSSFFMLPFYFASVASIILFLAYPKLRRWIDVEKH